jgi:hypothetical protein
MYTENIKNFGAYYTLMNLELAIKHVSEGQDRVTFLKSKINIF